MNATATLIRDNGMKVEVVPQNGKYFTLEELQDATGAEYVQFFMLNRGYMMIMNEEPKGQLNEKASYRADQRVYGHVLITRSEFVH